MASNATGLPDFAARQSDWLARFQRDGAQIFNPEKLYRARQGLRYVAPFLNTGGAFGDGRRRCLEVGCGEGAKALVLAPFFDHYIGVDIDKASITRARAKAARLGVTNVTFLDVEAADLGALLTRERFDMVLLYAVLEHLTIEERLNLLHLVWSSLPADGHLMVAEAPNRIAPIDYHSSRMPYFNLLPVAIAERVYDRSSHASWINRVRSEATLDLGLHRNGQHVGFEEFDLAVVPLTELMRHVVADGWADDLLNLNPLRWFETRNLEDFASHAKDPDLCGPVNIPSMFARYWIDALLSRQRQSPANPPVALEPDLPQQWAFGRDRFRMPVVPISDRAPWTFRNPRERASAPAARQVTIGLQKKGSLGRELALRDAKGRMIWQGAVAQILSATDDYWNPSAFRNFPLPEGSDASEITLHAKGGEVLVTAVLRR